MLAEAELEKWNKMEGKFAVESRWVQFWAAHISMLVRKNNKN